MTTLQLAPPLPRDTPRQTPAAGTRAPGATVEDLIAAAAEQPCPEPELLCLLVLAECRASPVQLLRGCPRDPRLRLVATEASARVRPAAPWCPPELVRGEEPVAASDLWGAAAVARALLRALRRHPSPPLAALLAAVQAVEPQRRPAAGSAAARARRLALLALAAWDARRGAEQSSAGGVRYAAAAQQQSSGWGESVAPWEARPGSEPVERRTGPGDRGPGGSFRAVAGSSLRGAPGPWHRHRAIMVALAPSLVAGLLSLLLAAMLLLGG